MRGLDLRPTADRLRETLFNVLTAGNPQSLEGSMWLDLYAGTGAVGIEALSRGAVAVCFVESSASASELIRKNLESLGVKSGFEVVKKDVDRALRELESRGLMANFVYLDPPYRMHDAYRQTLTLLAGSRLLPDTGIIIAEHEKRFDPGENFQKLQRYRKLEQGDATLSFYRRS